MDTREREPGPKGEPPSSSATAGSAAVDGTSTDAECARAEREAERAESGAECRAAASHDRSAGRAPREPFRLRKLVSLALVILFVATALSGLVLHLAPGHGAGRGVAEFAGWPVVAWASFHSGLTIALVVAGSTHLVLNARTLWCYLRAPRGGRFAGLRWPISRELLVALPLAGLLVAAAAWTVPSGGHGMAGRGGRGHAWRHREPGTLAPAHAGRDRGPRRGAASEPAARTERSARARRPERRHR